MAPAHAAHGRVQHDQPETQPVDTQEDPPTHGLFLEPMMGTPMPMYVQKDVDDRDTIVDLITRNGGIVSQGYSGVQYILVDPHKESGQNLYRQYAGKKTKIVLNAQWVHECVKAGALQNYATNFAGCKVTGNEQVIQTTPPRQMPIPSQMQPQPGPSRPPSHQQPPSMPQVPVPEEFHPQLSQPMQGVEPTGTMPQPNPPFDYQAYQSQLQGPPGAMHPAAGPPQSWQAANGIAPEQTQHMGQPQIVPHQMMAPRGPYREDAWGGPFQQAGPPPPGMVPGPPPGYVYGNPPNWVPNGEYYGQPFVQPYPGPYMEAGPSGAPGPSGEDNSPTPDGADASRGRKRIRAQPVPAPPAGALVVNRRDPTARSPTPPSRVIKSTYGGNLFTADDVMYLKKYIDFCQEQGLVLSLREICERVAVKAPHHTFYSWRRYCNKHQIRLGGYAMCLEPDDGTGGDAEESAAQAVNAAPGPSAIAAAKARVRTDGQLLRDRSPTPPRALFRSTTGKGVAFTDEDVAFLIRLLEHKKSQGKLDMVAFWKEIATKAPHHSRASWMKFYRRHKHELNHTEEDEPLPQAPEKKMRYSRSDDVLLAKFFFDKPDGTSDKIFQNFGRMHPHHPWKGWQEHHRIHKAKIDHLIQRLTQGEFIDEPDPASEQ